MHLLIVLFRMAAVAALILVVPHHALASMEEQCPTGAFETDPEKIAAAFQLHHFESRKFWERRAAAPAVIDRIKNGAKGEFVGAYINDGLASWWGYDADRHLFVSIAGKTGQFSFTRQEKKLGRHQAFRRNGKWSYLVTLVRATPQQAREFACRSNELMAWAMTHSTEIVPEPTPVLESEPEPETPSDSNDVLAEIKIKLPYRDRVPATDACPMTYYNDVFVKSFSLEIAKPLPALVLKPGYECSCSCMASAEPKYDELERWIGDGLTGAALHQP